ncbi:MAG: hypothetical protein AAFQ82_25910, partial [Myxococcota bacterium]
QARAGVSPQVVYESASGFRLAGGASLEAGKATYTALREGADLRDAPFRRALFVSAEVATDEYALGVRASENFGDPIDARRNTEFDLYGAWDVSERLGVGPGQRIALEGAFEFQSGESAFPWVDSTSVDAAMYAGVQGSIGDLDANFGVTYDGDSTTMQLGLSVNSDVLGNQLDEFSRAFN